MCALHRQHARPTSVLIPSTGLGPFAATYRCHKCRPLKTILMRDDSQALYVTIDCLPNTLHLNTITACEYEHRCSSSSNSFSRLRRCARVRPGSPPSDSGLGLAWLGGEVAGKALPLEVGAAARFALWSYIHPPSALAPPCPVPSLDPPYPQVLFQSAQTSARQLLAAPDYERSLLPSCSPARPNLGSRPGFVTGLRHRLPVARQPFALPQGLNFCPRRASRPPRAARLGQTRPPRLISASHTHLDGAVKHCADVASRTRAPLLFSGLAIRTRSGLTRNSVPSRGMHRRPGCSHCGGRRG